MKSLVWLRYELKNMLRDFKVVSVLFLGPLFLLALVGYLLAPLFMEDSQFEKIDIALVNLDQSRETNIMLRQFINNDEIQKAMNIIEVSHEEADQRLLDNKVTAVIIIPDGFSRDLMQGINTPVTVIANPNRPLQAAIVKQLMQSGVNMVNAAQSGINTVYVYMEKANVGRKDLHRIFQETVIQFTIHTLNRQEIWEYQTVSAYGELSKKQYYLINLGLIFVFFMGLFGIRISSSESSLLEKRLRSFGIGSLQVVIVRWLSLATFLIIPYCLYFTIVAMMMSDSFQGKIGFVVLISILTLLTISALFLTISSCLRNIATVNIISFVVIIGMPVVGGNIIPLSYLPHWVENLQILSLNYWLSQGMFISFFNGDQSMFWSNIFILSFIIIFLLTIALFIEKRRRDM